MILVSIRSAQSVHLFPTKTRNAWQSLVYSPLGIVVSPPSGFLWKTLTYWSPECLTAPSHSEHRWTNRGNNYRLRPYNFFRLKLLGSLIWILPNFHKMCRNDCRLTCWNQKIVIFECVSERQYAKWTRIVKFRTSRSTIFIFYPTNYSKTTGRNFTKFSHNIEASFALLMH